MTRTLTTLAAATLATLVACSSTNNGDAPTADGGTDAGVLRDGAVVNIDGSADASAEASLGLSDAAPACGAAGAACCPPGQKPLPWSHDGESCIPGFACQAGTCRSVEVGMACTTDADCPRSGHCQSVGTNADGGALSVCTTACASAAECTPGWDCKPAPGGQASTCQCTHAAETCNGKDDDCDGVVDGHAGDPDCASKLGAAAAACCGGGACVDLATSATNCGACGHDCKGGTCSNGACTPVAVAPGGDFSIEPISAAGGHVSFGAFVGCAGGNKSQLLHCAAVPCPSPDVVDETACAADFATLGVFTSVVTDPTTPGRVFYARAATLDGTLGALFVSGGGATKQQLAPATGGLTGPRVDAMTYDAGDATTPPRLWWGDAAGNVRSCAVASCATSITTLFTGTGPIGALAVDGTDVFVSTLPAGSLVGDVVSCPKAGCEGGQPRVVAHGELNVKSIVATKTNLYWGAAGTPAGFTDGLVRSCAKNATNCTPRSVGPMQAPLGLVADDNYLYLSNFAVGIRRCPVDNCTTLETIAPRIAQPISLDGLAQDDGALYFYDGALQRLAK
jgi:hypothetical protein